MTTKLEDLQKVFTEMLYDHLAGKHFYGYASERSVSYNAFKYEIDDLGIGVRFNLVSCSFDNITPMDLLWEESKRAIKTDRDIITDLENAIKKNKKDKNYVQQLKEQKQLVLEELEHLTNSNMEYQKKLYEETGDVSWTRNVIYLPLDKDITPNLLLEDFWLEFLFYDNIGVSNGVYEEYEKFRNDFEKRREFIKQNIEITHIALKSKKALAIKQLIPNATNENLLRSTVVVMLKGHLKENLPNNLIEANVNDLIKMIK